MDDDEDEEEGDGGQQGAEEPGAGPAEAVAGQGKRRARHEGHEEEEAEARVKRGRLEGDASVTSAPPPSDEQAPIQAPPTSNSVEAAQPTGVMSFITHSLSRLWK